MPEPLVIPRVKLTYNLLTTLGHAWLELYFWSLAIFVLPNILNNWPRCFSFYPSLGAPAWQIAGGFELCRRIGSFFFHRISSSTIFGPAWEVFFRPIDQPLLFFSTHQPPGGSQFLYILHTFAQPILLHRWVVASVWIQSLDLGYGRGWVRGCSDLSTFLWWGRALKAHPDFYWVLRFEQIPFLGSNLLSCLKIFCCSMHHIKHLNPPNTS